MERLDYNVRYIILDHIMEKSLKLSCSVYCLASLLFGLLSIAPTEVQRTLASLPAVRTRTHLQNKLGQLPLSTETCRRMSTAAAGDGDGDVCTIKSNIKFSQTTLRSSKNF